MAAQQVTLTQARRRPEEAEMYDLAAVNPSSAGFYLDRSGAMVVWVHDAIEDARSQREVTRLIMNGRVRAPRGIATPVVVRRAQYTFAQLATWRDVVYDSILFKQRGVVSLDLDETVNRVAIGVTPSDGPALRPQLAAYLARLGVDTGAVEFRTEEPARPTRGLGLGGMIPGNLLYRSDTMVGGIVIGIENQYAPSGRAECSLGFVADYNGVRGFVTASHCTPYEFGVDWSLVHQDYGGRVVGYEYADPQGYQCGYGMCRGSDASFFKLDDTVPSLRGLIARTLSAAPPGTGPGSTTSDASHPYFIVTGVDQGYYFVGMNVQKMGWKAGWTSGAIVGTCVDHQNGPWYSFYGTTCAYQATYADSSGDSGGPVFTFPGTAGAVGDLVELAGVQFGERTGYAMFSKFSRINNDFGGNLVATRPLTLGTPSVSGAMNYNNPSISWAAVTGATRYQIIRVTFDGSTVRVDYLPQVTSTSFVDGVTLATSYNGTTPIGSGIYAWYQVIAIGGSSELSAPSTAVWFQTTNTCTGRC
ncbi:MAG: hypothetical protein HY084_12025 [Gemmatimonadetes bacterium]|nr:hypothetical protein [Gemmatimonadota bacterium]